MNERVKEVDFDEPKASGAGAGAARPEFVRAAVVPADAAPAVEPVSTAARPVGRRRMLSMLTGTLLALTLVVGGVGGWEFWSNSRQFETVRNRATHTISLELPDGSEATLGPKSELKYLKGMWTLGSPDRQVWPKGEVTFRVRKIEYSTRGSTRPSRQSLFRIATPHAWVTIRTDAQVKVEAQRSATSVEMLEGAARIRRHTSEQQPVGEVIEVPARSGARATATGVETYQLPRVP